MSNLKELLEDDVPDLNVFLLSSPLTIQEAFLLSIAISLKRLADTTEHQRDIIGAISIVLQRK